MALIGNTNEEKIWNYLYYKLKNEYGVAGLIGNLKAESGLNPTNLQNTGNKKIGLTDEQYTNSIDNNSYTNFVKDSQGYGLAQWTYWNRKQNLLNFAKSKGVSIGDLEMQLDFLVTKELQVSYKSVWNKLLNATSVRQASDIVLMEFEKPANQSESVKITRSRYGQESYDKFVKQSNNVQSNKKCKVAIDSGHFSNSAGKRSPEGYREHWITTNIAYYLDVALKRCGIETLKVAWNDKNGTDDLTDLSLANRQKIIKNAKCDISISCHANAHGNGNTYTTAQGIETFVHSNSTKAKDSKSLANKVQAYLIKGTKQTNRGVKSSDFAMCNCTAMGTKASILVEYGFMTNKYEEELMKTESFCLECAEETAHGICDYLGVIYKTGSSTAVTPVVSTNNISVSTSFVHNGIDYSLVFNPIYYANKYSDLKKAFGNDSKKLFSHFCEYGMKEGRNGSATFNVQTYKDRYTDLKKSFGNNLPEYYKHWIQYGYKEGRHAT